MLADKGLLQIYLLLDTCYITYLHIFSNGRAKMPPDMCKNIVFLSLNFVFDFTFQVNHWK